MDLPYFQVDKTQGDAYLKARFRVNDELVLNDAVTALMTTNGLTHEMVLSGSRNGVLKVWDPYFYEHGHKLIDNKPVKLITAANLLSDQVRVATSRDRGTAAAQNSTLYK